MQGHTLKSVSSTTPAAMISRGVSADSSRTSIGQATSRPKLLMEGTALYPRLIRLAHAPGAPLLLSVITFDGPRGSGILFESRDDGATFTRVGEVGDSDTFGGQGLCCATLYELPCAVGELATGTLLWAASVGGDAGPQRRMSIRIWASHDTGRQWEPLATTTTAPNAGGLWEPEFAVSPDGELVLWFCDETASQRYSQRIVHQRSKDGRRWTAPVDTIALENTTARPGMPNVRPLPDGGWIMSYEVCGPDQLCRIYTRTFSDPRDTGPTTSLGSVVRAVDGTEPRHTPTLLIDDDGSILLGSQMLYQASDGAISRWNGTMALRHQASAAVDLWEVEPVPVTVENPWDNYCPNYSPSFARSRNGHLVHVTTRPSDSGPCQAWFGSHG